MADKILFIDANVYLRFYDSANNKFTVLLQTLVELKNYIFITQQIRDEVNRNKLVSAINSFDANYKSLGLAKTTLPEHLDESDNKKLSAWNKKRNKIINQESELKNEYRRIVASTLNSIMMSTDVVSIELDKIFALAKSPSIDEIEAARLRKEIGNPPGKAKDPLGDQLSWEQLLRYYDGNEIWIITNDEDYISEHNGNFYLNPVLHSELKRKSPNKTPKIKVFNSLAKGIEDFGNILNFDLNTLPSDDTFKQILIEELEIHLHPEMSRRIVESTNIASVGYDENTQTLEVEFQNGAVYRYHNVPKLIYDGLILSSSKSRYFHEAIKGGEFSYIKIK